MALSDYERLKRWRKKHPFQAKKKRIEYLKRKKNLPVPVLAEREELNETGDGNKRTASPEARESAPNQPEGKTSDSRGGQSSSKQTTIAALRAQIESESSRPVEIAVPLPQQKRYDDFGRPITEGQWRQLQERKTKATNAGYVIDEFSQ